MMNTQTILSAIGFAFVIVFPNLALMALGYYMQRRSIVNAGFIEVASNIVFNYCLPCLLFFSVLKSDVNISEQYWLLLAGFITTFGLFFLAEIYAKFFVPDVRDKGVFVQGVFRSNMAIISLATVANAYGNEGLGVGAVYMGIITILYNVLAVIALSRTGAKADNAFEQIKDITVKIFKNPLIIALILAFVYKGLDLPKLPEFINTTGGLLGAVALPLALICAGATLDIRSMMRLSGVSMQASMGRVIIAPLIAVIIGVVMALPPLQFGVLFLMVASPAASASYVMAKAMGGNDVLAANILGFTTVFGMISMAIGMAALRVLGWV